MQHSSVTNYTLPVSLVYIFYKHLVLKHPQSVFNVTVSKTGCERGITNTNLNSTILFQSMKQYPHLERDLVGCDNVS